MSENIQDDAIKRRLDTIIGLMLKQHPKDGMTSREQIALLNSTGLKYNEIAQILGRSGSYVASELTVLKKSAKKNSGEGGTDDAA
jgi:DNA-binding CsgD family transcriptional regulator